MVGCLLAMRGCPLAVGEAVAMEGCLLAVGEYPLAVRGQSEGCGGSVVLGILQGMGDSYRLMGVLVG